MRPLTGSLMRCSITDFPLGINAQPCSLGQNKLNKFEFKQKKIRLCHKPKIFHAFFEHRRRFAAAFYEMRHQECLLWKLMLENNRSVAVNNSFCLSLSLFSSPVDDNLWVASLFASDGRDRAHKSVIQCEVKGSPPSGGLGSWYTFRVLAFGHHSLTAQRPNRR